MVTNTVALQFNGVDERLENNLKFGEDVMDVTDEIRQMCLEHFNEPLLVDFKIARLVGYGEDETDCYLIVNIPGEGIKWWTACGGYTFLNRLVGQNQVVPKYPSFEGEIWDDLSRLDGLLTVRGVPREEFFVTG